MRKRMHIALMASTLAAISLSLTLPLRAAAGGDDESSDKTSDAKAGETKIAETKIVATKITASDEHGRKIYVNDSVAAAPSHSTQDSEAPRRALKYWSSKEKRWKAVPPPNAAVMRAAQSAAAEVDEYMGHDSSQSAIEKIVAANFRGPLATPADIDSAIDQAAARHNVDPNLVRAVVKVESNFNPNAVSRKGAMGLMQLMPATARQLKVKNPFDPEQNVDAGVRHLKQLLESFGGDVRLSLAAYNAGATAVARSSGVPRFPETQNYVRRITNLYYGGSVFESGASHTPVTVQRDARGVLYISNTD
jgi:soluble lytic murein transglycosylase-like protein